MELEHDKIIQNKTQTIAHSFAKKTIQNKAINLEDNRPSSILQRKVNNTGLPNNLKSGIENLSGQSMDDVKVHYNSDKPAQLNAHAYAQGSDIHIASGQEKHLPHEAWHVVQQKQGRVQPTMQMKGKVNINDDTGLEKEADMMGDKALQPKFKPWNTNSTLDSNILTQIQRPLNNQMAVHQYRFNDKTILQRVIKVDGDPINTLEGLSDYANITTLRDGVINKLQQNITEIQFDNAVRSADLSLIAGKDKQKMNEGLIIEKLTTEIPLNSKGIGEASETLSKLIPDKEVARVILNQVGSREVERLSGLIMLMWDSGQISIDKLIAILHQPEITHTYLDQFQNLLVDFSVDPLAMKMLGKQSVTYILDLLKDQDTKEAFIDKIKNVKQGAEKYDLNPMHIIEIDEQDRFLSEDNSLKNLNHDLQIINQDLDNNLKEDMAYMASLESTFNKTVPEPNNPSSDHQKLKIELSRMKKMFAYKINYITIIKHSSITIRQLDIKLIQDIKKLEQKSQQDIRDLEGAHKQITNFSPRATPGYKMKFTRKAERLQPKLEKNITNRKKQLEEELKKTKAEIDKDKKKLIKEITEFLNIDERYLELIKANVMLLPGDMRLAGIFPKNKSVTVKSNKENITYQILHQHAQNLLYEHGLYQGKRKEKEGMLPSSRVGCVCIMYIKEEGEEVGKKRSVTYRPVFGASGIDPYEEKNHQSDKKKEENSYSYMGLPKPSKTDLKHKSVVGGLQEHISSMKKLGIKQPSMQSQLYFLQTPEYQSNKIKKDAKDIDPSLISEAQKNTIGMLESWMPSNCAEPAIMTAIFQLYHKPSDIFLSVPFEGVLSNGKLLLKYTCTRCAVSEPAFISPDKSDEGQKLTDMRIGNDTPFVGQNLEDQNLVYNSENRNHPYLDKKSDIKSTMWRNQREGFAHVKPQNEDSAKAIMLVMQLLEGLMERLK